VSATPAIVVATFYRDLAERLVSGARAGFAEAGWGEPEVHEVPGAFELPLAARYCADSGRFGGIACLGAVIRGETDHYEYVCSEAASGIQRVQLDTGVPCSFGVLTVDTLDQALERTGGDRRDTGLNAALAVVALAQLRQKLS
jgi:6,7-dimethyl-8-ribityllumazine synthase